jgi:septal ring factor EnvC (AmiA/AmiB activator)
MTANMIDKNEQSIDDVCMMFRLAKHELEYIQEKFAAKKEKMEAKKKEKTEAKKKEASTEGSKTDETHLDILKDIRAILLRMEENLFNKN